MVVDSTIDTLARGGIIAILRGDFKSRELEIAAVLESAGITALEVTLNSVDAIGCIERLASGFGSRMAVGAGTVMTPQDVLLAADAGTAFIVSPNRDAAVIRETRRKNLFSIPGCFSPSEVIEALDAGADAIKLFPAVSLGSAFIRALHGPIPGVRLVPTGGISADIAGDYFNAGAWAIGVGSDLVNSATPTDAGLVQLRASADRFVAAARGRRPL